MVCRSSTRSSTCWPFKSDIGFWRNNKSMEGLSARSIIIQAFCQIVIFLYLLDNDTSYVVPLQQRHGPGDSVLEGTNDVYKRRKGDNGIPLPPPPPPFPSLLLLLLLLMSWSFPH